MSEFDGQNPIDEVLESRFELGRAPFRRDASKEERVFAEKFSLETELIQPGHSTFQEGAFFWRESHDFGEEEGL